MSNPNTPIKYDAKQHGPLKKQYYIRMISSYISTNTIEPQTNPKITQWFNGCEHGYSPSSIPKLIKEARALSRLQNNSNNLGRRRSSRLASKNNVTYNSKNSKNSRNSIILTNYTDLVFLRDSKNLRVGQIQTIFH